MNLIAIPQEQWQSVPFSNQSPKWKWESDRITQQKASNGKGFPTGFTLITSIEEQVNYLKCTFSPGDVYHSGIIFNYQDREHFMLVVVNNLSASYRGYQLLIGEVQSGKFSSVCVEKYKGRLDAECVLELSDLDGQLSVRLNDDEVFEWEDVGFDRQMKVGLYAQQNADTQFFELEVLEIKHTVDEIADDAVSYSASSNTQDQLTALPANDPTLQYLKLKPPAAKNHVEFTEVFSVPLDDFYAQLFRGVSSNTSVDSTGQSKNYFLDFRPKRWYRDLQLSLTREKHTRKRLAIQEKYITQLQDRDLPSQSHEVDALMEIIEKAESSYEKLTLDLSETLDAKYDLFSEIKSNGYEIYFDNTPDRIKNAGYEFHIVGGKPEETAYEPFKVANDYDFETNDSWTELHTDFQKYLFDSGVLSDETKATFTTELNQLANVDASDKITEELRLIDDSIAAYNREKAVLNKSAIAAERDRWQADSNHMLNHFAPILANRSLGHFFNGVNELYNWSPSIIIIEKESSGNYQWKFWLRYYSDNVYAEMELVRGSGKYRRTKLEGIDNFINKCRALFAMKIDRLDRQIATIDAKAREIDTKISHANSRKQNMGKLLAELRKAFIVKWNNSENFDKKMVTTNVINPDANPLAELLSELREGKPVEEQFQYKLAYFDFFGDRIYSNQGQSLLEFCKALEHGSSQTLAIFPGINDKGVLSEDTALAILNPQKSNLPLGLPSIKFVETYQTEIKWKGYGLGELSHSINLFPGESKELVIEKKTKINRSTKDSSTSNITTNVKTVSSFEEKLEDELSDKRNDKQEYANKQNRDTASSSSTSSDSTSKVDISAKGSKFGIGINASASKSRNTKKNQAFNASQKSEVQTANNQSKEVLRKNISNLVKKAATDTSRDNKLEIVSSSSEEYELSDASKETIKIENPNIGRTINYNFFQLQNFFEVTTELVDVKIVIDPRIELVANSKLSDIMVYELEEFGKIYPNLDQTSDVSKLLGATIARQVFKHYADFVPGISNGNGCIQLNNPEMLNQEAIETLNFSGEESEEVDFLATLTGELDHALKHLQQLSFEFQPVSLTEKRLETVNTGAYYLESEIGEMAATEPYLEQRRDIETDQKRAELAHLEAQTKAGVFFQQEETSSN